MLFVAHIAPGLTGLLAFMCTVARTRRGQTLGRLADAFLATLTVEIICILGLMADAGAECLKFIRLLDTEDLPVADLYREVSRFLDRIHWLFIERGVLEVPGHAAYLLKWLSKRHFYIVDGVGRCLGGEPLTAATLDTCSDHLASWVCLAREALRAECPEFDLISSFGLLRRCRRRPQRPL